MRGKLLAPCCLAWLFLLPRPLHHFLQYHWQEWLDDFNRHVCPFWNLNGEVNTSSYYCIYNGYCKHCKYFKCSGSKYSNKPLDFMNIPNDKLFGCETTVWCVVYDSRTILFVTDSITSTLLYCMQRPMTKNHDLHACIRSDFGGPTKKNNSPLTQKSGLYLSTILEASNILVYSSRLN